MAKRIPTLVPKQIDNAKPKEKTRLQRVFRCLFAIYPDPAFVVRIHFSFRNKEQKFLLTEKD